MKTSRATYWGNAAETRANKAEFEARIFRDPATIAYMELFQAIPSIQTDRIMFRDYCRESYDDLIEFAERAGSSEIGAEFVFDLEPIQGVPASWTIAAYASYTDEAVETLRAVGKMRTETQTYETLACN